MQNVDYSVAHACMMDGDCLIHFIVCREEIEAQDMLRIKAQMEECRKAGEKAKGSMVIATYGYDDDPRELAEIPEVRTFFQRVYEYFPDIFEYLVPDSLVITPILCCLLDIVATGVYAGNYQVLFADSPKNMELLRKVKHATGLSYMR